MVTVIFMAFFFFLNFVPDGNSFGHVESVKLGMSHPEMLPKNYPDAVFMFPNACCKDFLKPSMEEAAVALKILAEGMAV